MKFKKVAALAMTMVMVAGSSMTVFADDITGANAPGESTGHLDTDVVIAVLPTSSVDSYFAFTIDPENILDTAGKIKGGNTVESNENLVYFPHVNGTGESATTSYTATSEAVNIKAKNYVAADVKVVATVGAAADGKTIIPLAESADALDAATTPTLLLTLKVGTKSAAITSSGATVSDTIAAQDAKFDTTWDETNSKYTVSPKTKDASNNDIEWNGLDVQLSGKVKGGTTTADVVAPTVTLTWSVAKHTTSYLSATTLPSNRQITATLPTGVTVSSISLVDARGDDGGALNAGTHYSLEDGTYTFVEDASQWGEYGLSIKFTFSDDKTETVAIN